MDEDFINFLAEETGIKKGKIKPESTLLGDLKLDGDDAWELFESCQNKYGIDLSNFDFLSYFSNEPCRKGIIYLYRKLKYKDEHVASKKLPITVSFLYKSCISRVWEPAYNKAHQPDAAKLRG